MKNVLLFFLFTVAGSQVVHAQCSGFVQNTMGHNAAFSVSSDIDNNDNVYTIGYFTGTMTLGTFVLTPKHQTTGIFLSKIDRNGNVVYAKLIAEATAADVQSPNITVGTDGLLIEGVVHDTLAIDANSYTKQGNTHVFFVLKLSFDGDLMWSHAYFYNDPLYTGAFGSIVSDRNGGAFVATSFRDTLDLAGTRLSSGSLPVLIMHVDASGSILWTRLSGMYGGRVRKLVFDHFDNLDIAGEFINGISFDNKSVGVANLNALDTRLFVASYTATGNINWLWATRDNFTYPTGAYPIVLGMALDGSGDIYISGWIRDTLGFDKITLIGKNEMYIAKLDQTGAVLWAQTNAGHVSGRPEGGLIAIDSTQHVWLVGSFVDSIYLGDRKYTSPKAGGWFAARFLDSAHWDHVMVAQNTLTAYPQSINVTSFDSIIVTTQFIGRSTTFKGLTATNGNDTSSYAYNLAWFGPCNESLVSGATSEHKVRLYPNPTTDRLNIAIDDLAGGVATYHIINETGIEVQHGNVAVCDHSLQIAGIHSLPSGAYALRIDAAGQAYRTTFILKEEE